MNRNGTAISDRRRKPNKEIFRVLEAEPGETSTSAAQERQMSEKADWLWVFIDSDVEADVCMRTYIIFRSKIEDVKTFM